MRIASPSPRCCTVSDPGSRKRMPPSLATSWISTWRVVFASSAAASKRITSCICGCVVGKLRAKRMSKMPKRLSLPSRETFAPSARRASFTSIPSPALAPPLPARLERALHAPRAAAVAARDQPPEGARERLARHATLGHDRGHQLRGRHIAGGARAAFAGVDRGTHDAERGAVPGGGERTGVAVGQDRRAVLEERRAVRAEAPVGGHVFVVDGERLALEERMERVGGAAEVAREDPPHALDRPEEVDGRRPRGGEGPAQALEVALRVAAQRARAERDAHRGGHADRRGAADHHVLDGCCHVAVVAVDAVDLARREETLVEHHHASVAPLDGPDRHTRRLTQHSRITRGATPLTRRPGPRYRPPPP